MWVYVYSHVRAHAQVVQKREIKLEMIQKQRKEAQETDKDAMSSTLIVEGELMSFEIEELKLRLREREVEVRTTFFSN